VHSHIRQRLRAYSCAQIANLPHVAEIFALLSKRLICTAGELRGYCPCKIKIKDAAERDGSAQMTRSSTHFAL